MVNCLRTVSMDLVSIPGRVTEFSPQCPDRPWRPLRGDLSWQLKRPYVKPTIHIHLVWKLRICGAIPLIIHVPSWPRTVTNLKYFSRYTKKNPAITLAVCGLVFLSYGNVKRTHFIQFSVFLFQSVVILL